MQAPQKYCFSMFHNSVGEQKVSKCLSASSMICDWEYAYSGLYQKYIWIRGEVFSSWCLHSISSSLLSAKHSINDLNLKLCWKLLFPFLPGWLMTFLLYRLSSRGTQLCCFFSELATNQNFRKCCYFCGRRVNGVVRTLPLSCSSYLILPKTSIL